MTYVKNIYPINTLARKSPYKYQFNDPLDILYLRVLDSTIYVLIHKEE